MSVMAKKKPQPHASDSGPTKPISYRPSRAIETAMEEYRNQFEFRPDKSAVIERALREFFRSKGFDIPDTVEE